MNRLKAIAAILANDETSTDEELIQHFMAEFGFSRGEAEWYAAEREAALSNPAFSESHLRTAGLEEERWRS
jgi:hypothetical protein